MDPEQPDPFQPPPEQPAAKPQAITPHAEDRLMPPRRGRFRRRWDTALSITLGFVGVAALAAAAWVYADTRREIGRLRTDIAQIRLSLELFGRQQGTTPAPAPAAPPDLADIIERLDILEQTWRSAPAPVAAPPATAAPAAGDGDCLPTGTRFLVTSGDVYPVCGVGAEVAVAAVDDGFITLADSTVIARGGTFPLAGTACMLSVVSAGPELGGYAEIRVTC